ncbi:type II secretion system protein GspL [[Enterobacter] lignolyticus]|uniref:Type II secretion system protein L n=1 Tax=Enterobacter lignolyticus (strain SCF1) TaxID=701347 RepID=E3G242_ENTLS|nr:type II secretion system protein GspL [[Enterobacter] lignolyticus]ADO49176.1 general secretion pathway protein L [[Enterobacter] lignolyticus SCF1]
MKQVLFVRPGREGDARVWWRESGSLQVGELAGWDDIATLGDHALADRVCLLLPASEMIFRRFTLTGKRLRGQAASFSWLAEETVIGDVDELHWTVLQKRGGDVDAVAIARTRLADWLTRCADAGLTVVQVLPDAYLLPETAGGCTLASAESEYWLRMSPPGACQSDAQWLPLLLQKGAINGVTCYGDAPAGVAVGIQEAWQHPLLLIQAQWEACRISLLHGEFALRAGSEQSRRRYRRWLLAAAALVCCLFLLPPALRGWLLVQQENRLQDEMMQLTQHHFPSLRQASNLKYHFGQSVKKEKKGLFLQLEVLNALRQRVPGVQVNRIEYDDRSQRITLLVASSQQRALEQFVGQAEAQFTFALQPVSTVAPYTAMMTGTWK